MNVEKMFKTIAKHMIEYKTRLRANLSSMLRKSFDDFGVNQAKLNGELGKLLQKTSSSRTGRNIIDEPHPSNWRFPNYAYFIGSYLTTIGSYWANFI